MFACCVCDLLCDIAWLSIACVVVCLCVPVLLDVCVPSVIYCVMLHDLFGCDSLCDVV